MPGEEYRVDPLFYTYRDLGKYDMAVLQSDDKMDYKVALEMTSEILMLELIHRVIVCFYEVSGLRTVPP